MLGARKSSNKADFIIDHHSAWTEAFRLVVMLAPNTDFWQRTHYGFRAGNGHFLFCERCRDFALETTVHFEGKHQYDQAGLMVYVNPDCWLKTAVEHEPETENRLDVVATNRGYSDRSTQDFSRAITAVSLRIRRRDADYIVEYGR